jgi:hypothetical protein
MSGIGTSLLEDCHVRSLTSVSTLFTYMLTKADHASHPLKHHLCQPLMEGPDKKALLGISGFKS